MHSDTWYTLYITLRMHGSMVCTRSRVIYACMQNDGVRISKILLDVPRLSIIHPYMGIVHSPVYFISPVDPFHRASRRDGERISLWTASKLRSRFYRLLERLEKTLEKSSFHFVLPQSYLSLIYSTFNRIVLPS